MQIPILNGIYTNQSSDIRTSYPRNLVPVPKSNGVSNGYLRPAPGIVEFGVGPGVDRGGINWNGVCYRVMGTKLVRIDSGGAYTEIGDVGGTTQVTMDYSFTHLSIASNGNLFLYNGTTLQQVTDPDLGYVVDDVWVDGYFMTTDGTFLVVTELNDPFSVNPLKYGSSEADPDPIRGLIKIKNEVYALNRYTVEIFDNIGGDFFPFQRIEGAQIEKGVIGTHACCNFMEQLAFVGSGFNEAPSVYFGVNGQAIKIATREIDQILQQYTEGQLESCVCESVVDKAHQNLMIHLPDQTLVYDGPASQVVGEPIWYTLSSSLVGNSTYKARNMVWCYDKWLVGNPTSAQHGYMTDTLASHYGELVGYEFGTTMLYNEGRGVLLHDIELVCLPGRSVLGDNSTIWTQYSLDGVSWSQERAISCGAQGQTEKRLVWFQNGTMRNYRMQRFRGTSDAMVSFVRLEIRLEPLNV